MDLFKTSEPRLLLQLSEGSSAAFNTLYNQYFEQVNGFVLRYVKSPEMADDIAQEVFLKIWEHRAELKQVNSFHAYLFKMAKNHTLNVLKKASRSAEAMAEILSSYQIIHSPIESEMQLEAYWKALNQVLDTLPPQTRKVYDLCKEQQRSYDEVAQLLGISRNAVKKHLVRSNKVLKIDFLKKIDLSILLSFCPL